MPKVMMMMARHLHYHPDLAEPLIDNRGGIMTDPGQQGITLG